MNTIGKLSINDFPSIKFDGFYRVLACIPETVESKLGFSKFGMMMAAPLDPSQWREIDLQWYNNPIWNQGQTSSCASQSSNAGMQLCYMQSGRPLVEFNPYFTYGLVNNGRDSGSMISDCLQALLQTGACPKNDLPSGIMFKNQFPDTAYKASSRFKLAQAYRCDTFEEICAAITLGFVCPLGIFVDETFPRIDSQGVSPVPQTSRGGGHAILGIGLKKSSRYGWLIKIQNSWGCLDNQTEILTSEGWKKFEKIEGHESVATLNPKSHELEYEDIKAVHVYDYDGDLLHHQSRDIDLLVTPNHRMYYKKNHNYKKFGKTKDGWEIDTADSLPKNIHFKKNAIWKGEEKEFYEIDNKKVPMDLWLEFMGYFISEGHTSSSQFMNKGWQGTGKRKIKGKIARNEDGTFKFVNKAKDVVILYNRKDSPRIQTSYTTGISQLKVCNLSKIESCLGKLPFRFSKTDNGWVTNKKSLFMELKVFGKYKDKYIPSYIKQLPTRQLKIFFDALMLGDGSYSNGKVTYYTSSKRLADDFQELCLKLGYSADVSVTNRIGRKNKKGTTRELEYRVGIKRKEHEQRVVYNPEKVKYTGKVYCVTVPNGIIYVRRNGKAVWSGNSKFGVNGYSYIHKGHFSKMNPDAFAIQSIIDDPQDNTPADEVPVVTN